MNHHIFPISRITSIEYIICAHFLFAIIKTYMIAAVKEKVYIMQSIDFSEKKGIVKKAISVLDTALNIPLFS